MARDFWRTTAEAVVAAIDAVVTFRRPLTEDDVAMFADIPKGQAASGIALGVDLGLLKDAGGNTYTSAGFFAAAFSAPKQSVKAAALRLILEAYEPFQLFRGRLIATGDASLSAKQVAQVLQITLHADEVKDTLISLGQYAQAIVANGGGQYSVSETASPNALADLAAGCIEDARAEYRIREQLGQDIANAISRQEVIVPLANALGRSLNNDARGAVVTAGNAFESFLSGLGVELGVNLATAHGINAKLVALRIAGKIPPKLERIGGYLGHTRNAADHGVDADVGKPWDISSPTGIEYVYVACSLIRSIWGFTRPTSISVI